VRSAERWSTFTPRSLVKGGTSGRAIARPLLLAMPVHSTASAGRQRARDRPFAGAILAAGAADRTFNARVCRF
jgi:hypothetical protein